MADYSITGGRVPKGFGGSLTSISDAYYNSLTRDRKNRADEARTNATLQRTPYETASAISRYNADIYRNNVDAIEQGVLQGVVQQEASMGNYSDQIRTLISQYGVQGAINVMVSQGVSTEKATRDVMAVAYGGQVSTTTTYDTPLTSQETVLDTSPLVAGATKDYSY